MLPLLLISLCAIATAAVTTQTLGQPGKLVMWSSDGPAVHQYVTASQTVSDVVDRVLSEMNNFELAVVLSGQSSSSSLDNAEVLSAAKEATFHHAVSHVYSPDMKSMGHHFGEAKPLDTVVAEMQANPHMMSNGKPDMMHASMDNKSTLKTLLDYTKGKKTLFIAYQDAASAQSPRRLQSAADTADSHSIYYKPEGAEYSIYYADTYLYLTPDIFTGLMTGLFFVFVGYTGLTCLGSIQGMSSFYDKLPIVGREA